MAYTTAQLISQAFNLANVVSEGFEATDGPQTAIGQQLLEELLSEKIVEKQLIPYEGSTTLNSVIGQESYTVANLIDITTLTFIKDSVRYSMRQMGRDAYFGSSRAENISSLPFEFNFEPSFGGGVISLYYKPNQAYVFTIRGLFRLSSVTLTQDLSLSLESFYIKYLRYQLSLAICDEYGAPYPANVYKTYLTLRSHIKNSLRPRDLRIKKISMFNSNGAISYADINIGKGYRPIGNY